jgi:hypothetical protein
MTGYDDDTTGNTATAADLSDRELLDATERAAGDERHTTVELIALLAEVEERKLYLGLGFSTPFGYCTQVLRLSEHAAYHRIAAARAARKFPLIFRLLAEGDITLTTITLLGPHLTHNNHVRLLDAARRKSRRDVELQVATLAPRPDPLPVVRRLPAAVARREPVDSSILVSEVADTDAQTSLVSEPPAAAPSVIRPSAPVVKPIAPERYVIKVTVGAQTHARLRRAQDLLQHTIPGADAATAIDEALIVLVKHLERAKAAKVEKPRDPVSPARDGRVSGIRSRHIPANVRRAVWERDRGRCAFDGALGRCSETGRLEFHHVVPFADGGPTDAANISLRCRAHNGYERDRWFEP